MDCWRKSCLPTSSSRTADRLTKRTEGDQGRSVPIGRSRVRFDAGPSCPRGRQPPGRRVGDPDRREQGGAGADARRGRKPLARRPELRFRHLPEDQTRTAKLAGAVRSFAGLIIRWTRAPALSGTAESATSSSRAARRFKTVGSAIARRGARRRAVECGAGAALVSGNQHAAGRSDRSWTTRRQLALFRDHDRRVGQRCVVLPFEQSAPTRSRFSALFHPRHD